MSMRMFEALPTYLGGKRRLVSSVFKHIPPPSVAPVFADAFLGGGSVSLYAKARGYSVRCNDIAERSVAVGKALIENDDVRLADQDLLRLFVEAEHSSFCVDHLAPDVVTPTHAAFLDNAVAVSRSTPGPKGWLLRLLCIKYLLGQRPMGNFGAKTIVHQIAAGDFDEVNPSYLRDAVSRMVLDHPLAVVRRLAAKINGGVFANGQRHEAHHGDVFDFLRELKADVVYWDSPYAGTTSYEVALRPLDEMLAGHEINPEKSVFSRADSLDSIEELFALSSHIPVWAMSYGGPVIDLRMLMELMGKYRRRVHAEAVKYAHLAALADESNKKKNVELILIGWA